MKIIVLFLLSSFAISITAMDNEKETELTNAWRQLKKLEPKTQAFPVTYQETHFFLSEEFASTKERRERIESLKNSLPTAVVMK